MAGVWRECPQRFLCCETARDLFGSGLTTPGHHLGPAGAVDKKDLQDDPEGSQVAIIDIDVHHGNGTEAIVRNLKYTPEMPKVAPMPKLGFGVGDKKGSMTFGGAAVRPWLDGNDVDNVFFASGAPGADKLRQTSIHGFGGGFYPGTGGSCSRTAPRIINAPLKKGSGPAEFRRSMRRDILPQLQEFHPDLIFIASGFDGHEDDLIGCCELSEEDYIWATQQLMAVANRCCNGRLVSVLEGGYNTRGEALSPFASAVASHVRTLMYTSLNYTYSDWEGSGLKLSILRLLSHSNIMAPAMKVMKAKKVAMKAMKGQKAMTKGGLTGSLADATEIKKADIAKVLNSLAEIGTEEVKKSGKFILPGLCMIKTRQKPATKAGKKLMFGKEVMVKARPAKTVVKAFPVAALKREV
ncbi:unnamed protein product [Cladocopium goreaui]|uniref:Type-2 histone deacetylase 2 n=2 Tax=Cladocopium goreaui TaxID=2562237 RepID=A0A9P1CF18_9DINO|nr:unnamed protein product [Cladocopium goreaui]